MHFVVQNWDSGKTGFILVDYKYNRSSLQKCRWCWSITLQSSSIESSGKRIIGWEEAPIPSPSRLGFATLAVKKGEKGAERCGSGNKLPSPYKKEVRHPFWNIKNLKEKIKIKLFIEFRSSYSRDRLCVSPVLCISADIRYQWLISIQKNSIKKSSFNCSNANESPCRQLNIVNKLCASCV